MSVGALAGPVQMSFKPASNVLDSSDSRHSSSMDTSDDLQLQKHMSQQPKTTKPPPKLDLSSPSNLVFKSPTPNQNASPRSFSKALQQRLSEQKELWSNINSKLHEFENIKQHIAQEYPKMKQKMREYQDQISELRLQNQQMTYLHYEQSKQQNETIEKLMETNKKINDKYQKNHTKVIKYETENNNLKTELSNKSQTIEEYKSLLDIARTKNEKMSDLSDQLLVKSKQISQLKNMIQNEISLHIQMFENTSNKLHQKANVMEVKLNKLWKTQKKVSNRITDVTTINSFDVCILVIFFIVGLFVCTVSD